VTQSSASTFEWNGRMSQSLLYHAFGIPKTYRYVRTEYQQGAIGFTRQQTRWGTPLS
jgi:hypothetical protein